MRYAIVLSTLIALLAIACGGDGSPGGSSGEAGGMEGFRAFARQIEQAIAVRDSAFFIDRAVLRSETCPDEPQEFGPCAGQPAGVTVEGIPSGIYQSDAGGYLAPGTFPEELDRYAGAALPGETDQYGDSALVLYALARGEDEGREVFHAITTSIVDTYPTGAPIGSVEREAHIFTFEFQDARWRFTRLGAAVVSRSAADWLSGQCEQRYIEWERWSGAGGTETTRPAPTATSAPQTAATSERGVYVVRPDGGGLRGPLIPFDLQVFRWSPDSTRVAVAGICGAVTVSAVDVASGAVTEAASFTGDRFLHGLEWAPDSTRLLVGVGPARVEGAEAEPQAGRFSLVNADGEGEPQELFQGEAPGWSPDGTKIAYVDIGGASATLKLLTIAGGETVTIATGVGQAAAVWSPDGSRLAFPLATGESELGLTVINADGSGQIALAPAAQSFAVAWTANGQRLVFLQAGAAGASSVATVPAAGGPVEALRTGYSFDVSGDGNTVAVYDNLQDGRTEIEVFDLTTGQSRLVSGDLMPVGDTVALSPDGSQLIFNIQDSAAGRRDLYVVNADGSGLRKLVQPNTAIGAGARWSPDGRLIAFNDTVITSCI